MKMKTGIIKSKNENALSKVKMKIVTYHPTMEMGFPVDPLALVRVTRKSKKFFGIPLDTVRNGGVYLPCKFDKSKQGQMTGLDRRELFYAVVCGLV